MLSLGVLMYYAFDQVKLWYSTIDESYSNNDEDMNLGSAAEIREKIGSCEVTDDNQSRPIVIPSPTKPEEDVALETLLDSSKDISRDGPYKDYIYDIYELAPVNHENISYEWKSETKQYDTGTENEEHKYAYEHTNKENNNIRHTEDKGYKEAILTDLKPEETKDSIITDIAGGNHLHPIYGQRIVVRFQSETAICYQISENGSGETESTGGFLEDYPCGISDIGEDAWTMTDDEEDIIPNGQQSSAEVFKNTELSEADDIFKNSGLCNMKSTGSEYDDASLGSFKTRNAEDEQTSQQPACLNRESTFDDSYHQDSLRRRSHSKKLPENEFLSSWFDMRSPYFRNSKRSVSKWVRNNCTKIFCCRKSSKSTS